MMLVLMTSLGLSFRGTPVVHATHVSATKRIQPFRQSTFMAVRGGATSSDFDDDEAAELDAYIEQLLKEVEDENNESDTTDDDVTQSATNEMASLVDNDAPQKSVPSTTSSDSAAVAKQKSSSSSVKTANPKKKDQSSPTKDQKEKHKEKKKSVLKATNKSKKTAKKSVAFADKTEIAASRDNSGTDDDTTRVAASSTDANMETQRRPPPPPPNGLYRFLLRRAGGLGGRAAVLVLVTISEFLHTYVPPLAQAGDWMYAKVFPPKRRGRRVAPPSSSVNRASVSRMARTGVARSKRRKLTKQADQQALAQLQKKPVTELRYAFCSQAFCQRHGLGKWALATADKTRASDSSEGALIVTDDDSMLLDEQDLGKSTKKKRKKDWVLAALSKEPKHKREPTVSLSVGSEGLTIGVELDWSGQKERVRAALTLPSRRSKLATKAATKISPRKSDADGGVVGRLRAAAGSSVARSLSGAYPGDALGVDDAGNPYGLTDFATKYGYGDWSDSDEEIGVKRKRKRRKHSTKEKSHKGNTDNFGVPFSAEGPSRRTRHRVQRSLSPELALSSSSTLTRKRKVHRHSSSSLHDTPSSSRIRRSSDGSKSPAKVVSRRRVEMPKASMSRVNELKRKKSSSDSTDDKEK